MLTRLELENFRSFRSLTVEKLARVNLFVGKNNVGKTSLLQGAEILIRGGGLTAIWISAKERRELATDSAEITHESGAAVDPSHLFHGHVVRPGSRFVLRGGNGTPGGVACDVEIASTKELFDTDRQGGLAGAPPPPPLPSPGGLPPGPLSLVIKGPRIDRPTTWPLTSDGALYLNPRRFMEAEATPLSIMWSSVGTGVPDTAWLGTLWNAVVLGPQEERVTDVLRLIEPDVERLAFVPGPSGGFFVKLAGAGRRVPLGSMGEGMQRALSLALHLVRAEKSYLLVDEIDTGLHHSVMETMWRMVIETARRLDVQVFATTHSLDCVHALGLAYEHAPDVLLHQINRGRPATMIFTAEDVVVAAEHQMEIR